MASSILVNQLIVVGTRKNYTVNFNPGVNIIYGDSATGKSSILNLIDYLLGAKKFDSYPEIESLGKYAVLDVTLNEDRYSIKRDIFDSDKLIEIYQCAFDEIENYPCVKYLPKFSKTSLSEEYGFYSDFLFESLNLATIKLKDSPSKADSKLSRLSFRDLIKYCYVDQDDLGSKRFLDRGNYVLESRNSEVFKYIFNSLDGQVSEIQQKISVKANEKNRLEKKYKSVSEFLRDSEFGSMECIDDEISNIDEDAEEIKGYIREISAKATADNEIYRATKSILNDLEKEVLDSERTVSDYTTKIEDFTRLKNDYVLDVGKFKSAQESEKYIGEISSEVTLCPVCDNVLKVDDVREKFDITAAERINHEVNSLNRRIRDVGQLVSEYRAKLDLESIRLKQLVIHKDEARHAFDLNTKDLLTPYISERDVLVSKLGSLEQKRSELNSRLKIRNHHELLNKKRSKLDTDIGKLQVILDRLRDEAPSLSNITTSMADNLKDYLKYVNIKDPAGISLSENKYFPMVRNVEYQNITSGGLRTITCIGYLCSFLRESIKTDMNYPPFLMVDTVGKYLGKTQDKYKGDTSDKDDKLEGVSDPSKYQNIYEYIINLSKKFEEQNKICQMILIDNDVPEHILDELSGFVVAHFSSERTNGLPVGFIDDAEVSYQ